MLGILELLSKGHRASTQPTSIWDCPKNHCLLPTAGSRTDYCYPQTQSWRNRHGTVQIKLYFKKKDWESDMVPGPWFATHWLWVRTFWLCLLHFACYSMGTSTHSTSVTQPGPWRGSRQQDSVVITAKAWAINFIAQQYGGPQPCFLLIWWRVVRWAQVPDCWYVGESKACTFN